jgi:hypothetical protein
MLQPPCGSGIGTAQHRGQQNLQRAKCGQADKAESIEMQMQQAQLWSRLRPPAHGRDENQGHEQKDNGREVPAPARVRSPRACAWLAAPAIQPRLAVIISAPIAAVTAAGISPLKSRKASQPANCRPRGASKRLRGALPLRVRTGTKWVMAPTISGMMPITNTRWVTAAGDASPKRSRTSAARKVAMAGKTQVDQHDLFLLDEVVPRPRQVSSRRFRLLLGGLLPGLRAQDAGVRLSGRSR